MRTRRETGTVVRLEGDRALVRFRHQGGPQCRGCTACKPAGDRTFALRVPAEDLATGDRVTVEIPVPSPWRALALVFVLPLVGLMAGMAVGSAWKGLQRALGLMADAAALALGCALALAAFALAVFEERRLRRRHVPRVVKEG